jgi:hypothetical protein
MIQWMPRLPVLVVGAFAALVLAAAGCGGDDDGGSGSGLDAQTYAAEVCSLALAWTSAENDIDALATGDKTEAQAVETVSLAQGKTVSFVNLVKGIEEPAGETEQAAYASLQQTADALDGHSRAIRAEGSSLADGEQTGAEAAEAVKEQIDLIYGDLRESIRHLDAIATDADLTAIVRDDQSCRALGL